MTSLELVKRATVGDTCVTFTLHGIALLVLIEEGLRAYQRNPKRFMERHGRKVVEVISEVTV